MSIASKILPAIALVTALSPLAAHATSNPQSGLAPYLPTVHVYAEKNVHVDKVMTGSATIDRPSAFYKVASDDSAPLHHPAEQQNVRVDEVIPGSATIDSPSPIYSDDNINKFRNSAGG